MDLRCSDRNESSSRWRGRRACILLAMAGWLTVAGCATRLPTWRPRTNGPALGDAVRVWTERVSLPTYEVTPDPLPRFPATDAAKFYPYPAQREIAAAPTPRIWTLVCLENEYLIIKVMPQLGGRVYTIYDKLSGQDVVYRPSVIKPTTAGIRGAWICGGIEYNFPDCHTVTTHDEIHWTTRQYADGSASILIGDIERISHMSWMVEFRLSPGRACLEDRVSLYNRTPMRQRYFYWTNACVEGNEQTQIIFPFPKAFVGNHRARVVDWPMREGLDWSYCRTYDEGTSAGGIGGAEDFFGSYDHGKGVGLAYYSDHQALPARKFWTWGTGTMGRHWAKLVSDDHRPYLELQAGPAITSSEFAWLQPYESKNYSECWIPVSRIGPFTRANPQAVVRLSVAAHQATAGVLALRPIDQAQVELLHRNKVLRTWNRDLSPERPFLKTLEVEEASDLRLVVRDLHGKVVIEHTLGQYATDPTGPKEVPGQIPRRVDASTPAGAARRFELLWLDNQYAQAADTIEKALATWPDDPQVRFQAGIYRLFQGLPADAGKLLEKVAAGNNDLAWQAKYYLALARFQMGELEQAVQLLGQVQKMNPKLPQARAWHRAARILRARLLLSAGQFRDAFTALQAQLRAEPGDAYVAALATYAAGQDRGVEAAYRVIQQYLAEPDLEPMARLETQVVMGEPDETLQRMLLRDPEVAIDLACDYIGIADWTTAHGVLTGEYGENATSAMTRLMASWCAEVLGKPDQAKDLRNKAAGDPVEFVQPSRVEELAAIEAALRHGSRRDARAAYYAGLVLMRLMCYDEAILCWQQAIQWQDDNPLARHCLGMAIAKIKQTPEQAVAHLERAVELGPGEPGLYRDLADLYADLGKYEQARDVLVRAAQDARPSDRIQGELAYAHLTLGEYAQAATIFSGHRFRGGDTHLDLVTEYIIAHLGCGLQALLDSRYEQALADFDRALKPPQDPAFDLMEDAFCLGTLHFWRGMALQHLSRPEDARRAFEQAAKGATGDQAFRSGYPEMLDTVHAMLALRVLQDAPRYAQRVALVSSQMERMRRWERNDRGKALAAFCRTWSQAAQSDTSIDPAALQKIAENPNIEPEWAQLSVLIAKALPRCNLPKAPTTQVAGR